LGFFKNESKDGEQTALEPIEFEEEEIDLEVRQKEIDRIRNKSGLAPQHHKMLYDQVPYETPQSWVHQTLKYQRKLYGKLGAASGVDPSKF
jgi:hypothetical protein